MYCLLLLLWCCLNCDDCGLDECFEGVVCVIVGIVWYVIVYVGVNVFDFFCIYVFEMEVFLMKVGRYWMIELDCWVGCLL